MPENLGKALLFDIDGTLTDTDALHLEAFNRIFAPRGEVFDHARFTRELQGFSLASIKARFLAGEPADRQDAIMDEKEAIFRELASAKIEPLPGLMALLDRADRAGVPMAAVTNAPRLNAEMMLRGLGITHRFRADRDRRRTSARQAASAALPGRPARHGRRGRACRSRSRTRGPACSRHPRPALRPSACAPASVTRNWWPQAP